MAYILLIDDDHDFAAATATVLKNAGHDVKIELDINNALNTMNKKIPDLVIMDVMFPQNPSAGFDLARKMRHNNNNLLKNIPLLMLTAINSKFPLGLGANDADKSWLTITDFLEKPVNLDVLLNKVAHLVYKDTKV